VRWLGFEAGRAELVVQQGEGTWTAVATSRSTGMADVLYPVRDRLEARWGPGGSIAYDTSFREGRFHQDNRVAFQPGTVRVARRQLLDGAWKDSTFERAAPPGTSDPIHALWQIARAGGNAAFPLFTGSRILPLDARTVGSDVVRGAPARRVEIRVADASVKGDRAITAWLSDAAPHVPLRVSVPTSAGAVDAEWIEP
jgi:hypothetical protein